MAQRTKGGMWCDVCQRAVLGIKTTARTRNTLMVLGALPTAGASLLGAKNEGYVCQTCGSPVHRGGPRLTADAAERAREAQQAPPDHAFCTLCWHRLYAGDTACPSGHPMPPGWEEAFRQAQGAYPERRRQEVAQLQSETSSINRRTVVEELKDLAELRAAGAVSQTEFERLKSQLLGS